MFTGIIEEVGSIDSITRGTRSAVLAIRAQKVLGGTKIGDSICVDGVCLTVTALSDRGFMADAMPETLDRSTLGLLSVGSPVNLERALCVGERLGGHMVSGHIDGVGTIRALTQDDNAVIMAIEAPSTITALVVDKGSIAINGISLTVMEAASSWFSVSIIPHTFAHSDLADASMGTAVNLECDIIAKYVARLLGQEVADRVGGRPSISDSANITYAMLAENGFS